MTARNSISKPKLWRTDFGLLGRIALLTMRSRTSSPTAVLAVCALAVGIVLTGCVPQTARPTKAPSTTMTPVFSSDEEALQAATEAFRVYLTVADSVLANGGPDPERLRGLVSERLLPELIESNATFMASGLRVVGETVVDSIRLQTNYTDQNGARIILYVCSDISATRLIDADGNEVERVNPQLRVPLEVTLVSSSAEARHLLVDGSELWPGVDFC